MDGQVLLTQGRCVDVLLDLYLVADDELRWSIAERLRDIRHLRAVDGGEMRDALRSLAADAARAQLPLADWSRAALEACGARDTASVAA
jgi:hypothetical protein